MAEQTPTPLVKPPTAPAAPLVQPSGSRTPQVQATIDKPNPSSNGVATDSTGTALKPGQIDLSKQPSKDEPTLNDSEGRLLEAGDSVDLRAQVKSAKDGKVELVIFAKDGEEISVGNIEAGLVRHSGLNPRIGADPKRRTPVTEFPAKGGGVVPVGNHIIKAEGEEFKPKDDVTLTDGLPTATAEHAERLAMA